MTSSDLDIPWHLNRSTIAAFGFQVSKYSMIGQLETFGSAVALVPIRTCAGTPRFDTQQMQILEIPEDPESGLDPTFSFGLSIALEQGNLIIRHPRPVPSRYAQDPIPIPLVRTRLAEDESFNTQ